MTCPQSYKSYHESTSPKVGLLSLLKTRKRTPPLFCSISSPFLSLFLENNFWEIFVIFGTFLTESGLFFYFFHVRISGYAKNTLYTVNHRFYPFQPPERCSGEWPPPPDFTIFNWYSRSILPEWTQKMPRSATPIFLMLATTRGGHSVTVWQLGGHSSSQLVCFAAHDNRTIFYWRW